MCGKTHMRYGQEYKIKSTFVKGSVKAKTCICLHTRYCAYVFMQKSVCLKHFLTGHFSSFCSSCRKYRTSGHPAGRCRLKDLLSLRRTGMLQWRISAVTWRSRGDVNISQGLSSPSWWLCCFSQDKLEWSNGFYKYVCDKSPRERKCTDFSLHIWRTNDPWSSNRQWASQHLEKSSSFPAAVGLRTQPERQCSGLQLCRYLTCKGSLQNIYSAQ